jgi:hypothetical protein
VKLEKWAEAVMALKAALAEATGPKEPCLQVRSGG